MDGEEKMSDSREVLHAVSSDRGFVKKEEQMEKVDIAGAVPGS